MRLSVFVDKHKDGYFPIHGYLNSAGGLKALQSDVVVNFPNAQLVRLPKRYSMRNDCEPKFDFRWLRKSNKRNAYGVSRWTERI